MSVSKAQVQLSRPVSSKLRIVVSYWTEQLSFAVFSDFRGYILQNVSYGCHVKRQAGIKTQMHYYRLGYIKIWKEIRKRYRIRRKQNILAVPSVTLANQYPLWFLLKKKKEPLCALSSQYEQLRILEDMSGVTSVFLSFQLDKS